MFYAFGHTGVHRVALRPGVGQAVCGFISWDGHSAAPSRAGGGLRRADAGTPPDRAPGSGAIPLPHAKGLERLGCPPDKLRLNRNGGFRWNSFRFNSARCPRTVRGDSSRKPAGLPLPKKGWPPHSTPSRSFMRRIRSPRFASPGMGRKRRKIEALIGENSVSRDAVEVERLSFPAGIGGALRAVAHFLHPRAKCRPIKTRKEFRTPCSRRWRQACRSSRPPMAAYRRR